MDDLISRNAAIDAIDLTTWYHQNKSGEMVEGANSEEHQAWYKAEDVYKALNNLPSAQPEIIRCKDCIYHQDVTNICEKWSRYGTIKTKETGYCYRAKRRVKDE